MLASTTSERASVYVRYVRVQEREYRTFYRLIFLRVYSHATGPLAVLSLQLPVLWVLLLLPGPFGNACWAREHTLYDLSTSAAELSSAVGITVAIVAFAAGPAAFAPAAVASCAAGA